MVPSVAISAQNRIISLAEIALTDWARNWARVALNTIGVEHLLNIAAYGSVHSRALFVIVRFGFPLLAWILSALVFALLLPSFSATFIFSLSTWVSMLQDTAIP